MIKSEMNSTLPYIFLFLIPDLSILHNQIFLGSSPFRCSPSITFLSKYILIQLTSKISLYESFGRLEDAVITQIGLDIS